MAAAKQALLTLSLTLTKQALTLTLTLTKQALLAFYPGEGKRVDSWEGKRVRPTAASNP